MSAPADKTLRAEVFTRLEQLEAIAEPWRRLWLECQWATPFQSPQWLLPWCRCWTGDRDSHLHALALWRGDALVGLAAWRIDTDDGGRRRALLIGAGTSDYLDALVDPDAEPAAAAALRTHLALLCAQVDVCELTSLAPDGALARLVDSGVLGRAAAPGPVSPVLAVADGTASLPQGLPDSQYKKLQYYRRRLARSGSAEFQVVDEEHFDAQFSELVRLHTARWNGRGEAGVLGGPLVARFHRQAARALLQHGLLRMYLLRLDGRAIAAYYGLHAHRRSYFYLSGFDPAYRKLSPGVLIVGHALEQAIEEQASAFDFLRGRETYKYTWGARDRPTYQWRWTHR